MSEQVFNVLPSGAVVLFSEGPNAVLKAAELMDRYASADFNFFIGRWHVLPMEAEPEPETEWTPTRWHRLVTPDGEVWMETSDENEIKDELSGETYRDTLEDAEEGETIVPPPALLIHQRLYQAPVKTEWRNVDG